MRPITSLIATDWRFSSDHGMIDSAGVVKYGQPSGMIDTRTVSSSCSFPTSATSKHLTSSPSSIVSSSSCSSPCQMQYCIGIGSRFMIIITGASVTRKESTDCLL